MPYEQYTLSQLVTEISTLLNDTGNVYWTQQEITFAIYEGMREWSANTQYWRNRGVFPITSATPWYDLSVQLPTLRPRTVTVNQIVQEIQYHLSEAANGISGTGMTSQFSITEILNAVERARNQFVIDARMPLTLIPSLAVSSPPDGRETLPDTTVYVHRATWLDSNNKATQLRRTDLFAEDAANPSWNLQPDTPEAYSIADTPPLQIQIYPPPIASGTIELLVINSIDIADGLTTSTTLALPDDFCHAVKYLAMTDLLTVDGETANPVLAQYCVQRYQSILDSARIHKSVYHTLINGVYLPLAPLASIDSYISYWRSRNRKPQFCGALFDFVAFCPVPNGSYSITMDVVSAAPIPASGSSYIQLGREEINALVDYCEHYLSVKVGGDEFVATMPAYDKFQKLSAQRSGIIDAQSRYLTDLFNQSEKEQVIRPYAETATK